MSLDVFQQVFTLSIISNLVSSYEGTQESLQKELQALLPSAFPGPEWKLVWGPVVWKHLAPEDPNTGPDNSWYVAFHPNLKFEDGSFHPTYVIAIAGTPPDAPHVWETQNLAVDTVSDFRTWVDGGIQELPVVVPANDILPGRAYIATGTVNTVHLLLTTPAPEGAISAGQTLFNFFVSQEVLPSTRFVATGHSLGGALSPSLALSLVAAGVLPADGTLTYPTAGPSPGDAFFKELFVQTLPARKAAGARSYQGWNLNLVNTLDIVPQAWCTRAEVSPEQNIPNIPPIYGRPTLFFVEATAGLLAIHANASGVIYDPLPSQYFTGTAPPTTPADLNEFLATALEQHEGAYLVETGLGGLRKRKLPGPGVHEKTAVAQRFDYPVIAGLEWAREHPKEAEEAFKKAKLPPRGEA